MCNKNFHNDIGEDDVRIIRGKASDPAVRGDKSQVRSAGSGRTWKISAAWVYAVVALVLIALGGVLAYVFLRGESGDTVSGRGPVVPVGTTPEQTVCGNGEPAVGYVDVVDTVADGVPLKILFPVNARPRLVVGRDNALRDTTCALVVQAADVRGDNGEINGAFVLDGRILSRGSAKSGFCAIIDGKIAIGVATATPLFETAVEQSGSFFRQYPLVVGGQIVENKPKGRSYRKALAEIGGRTAVIMSGERITFHDFSRSLVNVGVSNAIYLVGSESEGLYRDGIGCSPVRFGNPTDPRWDNVNFIVWK